MTNLSEVVSEQLQREMITLFSSDGTDVNMRRLASAFYTIVKYDQRHALRAAADRIQTPDMP
jgi:hypothetical protein